jgi:hypothetical protein
MNLTKLPDTYIEAYRLVTSQEVESIEDWYFKEVSFTNPYTKSTYTLRLDIEFNGHESIEWCIKSSKRGLQTYGVRGTQAYIDWMKLCLTP